MWKDYFTEIEKGARYTFACTCAAIGCTMQLVIDVIDLLIAIPEWIAGRLNDVAKLAVQKYQKEGKYTSVAK